MFKFVTRFFKKKEVVEPKPDHEERIDDLEGLATLQAQVISTLIDRLDEVKKFREIYVEDMRVFANAIANLDKRTHTLEELVQHMHYEIAEIDENSGDDDDDDEGYTSHKPKGNLN